ncbi:MAG: hypothetical protein M3Q07_28445 [Pseudobdellovibrionaceae bacterium]|uniref:hypothetical protein n=1 Tax=Oligoflexus sp. TaxID=1971216 RepID=UPI0027CEAC33|nr:hypothetical protein [Oligoflexus sp.]MDQ3235756.1 hypothetical protein [Pseudobdellovibrionaceae bacterium]HYX36411.1 hypothetical protein [Oligoflexus sp.]
MKTLGSLACLLLLLLPTQARAELLDGFEKDNKWRLADWGDESKSETTETSFTEGQKSLKIFWLEGAQRKGKGIVIERDISSLGREFTSLRLDIELPEISNAQVAMAIDTDEYFESMPFNLEKGWNRDVVFYLKSKTWKAKTTSWQYQSAVNLTTVPKKIYLLFFMPDQPTGIFHLDNIRLAQEVEPQVSVGPQAEQQPVRSKKNHYRPRELPIEIFIRP